MGNNISNEINFKPFYDVSRAIIKTLKIMHSKHLKD